MFSRILGFARKEWVLVLILLICAGLTRFWVFGEPNRIVFDELYFAKFVSHYYLHSYYFDIHPPLAKLIMASVAQLTGANPVLTFGYNAINDTYPDNFYLLLRGIVSFFGTLLPLGVYALARSLKFSIKVSFLAGLFIILDNTLLVQSRFILTDVFLLTFGVFGLALVISAFKNSKIVNWPASWRMVLGSLLIGASYSVKWTGLLFLGLAVLYVIIRYLSLRAQRPRAAKAGSSGGASNLSDRLPRSLRSLAMTIGIILAASFLVYFVSMSIHIAQLNKTGPGDAFMSTEYQATLLGNPNYPSEVRLPEVELRKPGPWEKFTELNSRMYSANAGITAEHPYGSKWYSWPLLQRTVYYWYNRVDDSHESRIYLLGNPLIWWPGLLAMLYLLGWSIVSLFRKRFNLGLGRSNLGAVLFILAGFLANLLPFIFISRVAFLYHYFPSLVFLVIGLAFVIGQIRRRWIIGAIVLIIAAAFLWISPLSYGTPLTSEQFQSRMLFKSWE